MSVKEIFESYSFVLIVCLLISLTIHEYAHALMAVWLGDETPKKHNRLSLNPFNHLSIIGTLVFLFTQKFGWARPVPISFEELGIKKTALVAIAGPFVNLILALLSAIILMGLKLVNIKGYAIEYLAFYLSAFIYVNSALFFINMLPIPPLDGFRISLGLAKKINKNWDIPDYEGNMKGYFLLDLVGAFVLGGLLLFSKSFSSFITSTIVGIFSLIVTL